MFLSRKSKVVAVGVAEEKNGITAVQRRLS